MHAQQRLICIDICVFKGCKISCSCHDTSRLIESFSRKEYSVLTVMWCETTLHRQYYQVPKTPQSSEVVYPSSFIKNGTLLMDLINYDRKLLRWLGSDTNEVDAISVALPVRQVVAQVGAVNANTLAVW